MLKPNAAISARSQDLALLVAEFVQRGGVIEKQETGVAKGLKRRKFIKK